jgi:transporter family protein
VILLPVLAIFWFPGRRKTTPFRWRWAIPAIGLTLVIADFLYFYALSCEGSMISVIAALRRVSVLVTFAFGAFILGEVNLKQKGIYLLGILIGTLLITLGSS